MTNPAPPTDIYSLPPRPVPPKRGPVVLAAVLGAALGAGASVLVLSRSAPPPAAALPVASASASVARPEPEPEPPSLTELASRGEQKALDELKGKPPQERTAAEIVALARGNASIRRQRIGELKRKLELLPKFGRSPDARKEILALAQDREFTTDTLQMLAGLANDVGPDLLYAVMTSTRGKSPTAELAEQLLYSPEVRPRASAALATVLALRDAETCEEAEAALTRAEKEGDARALKPIGRFNARRGCGGNKLQDCWPCLRKGKLLRAAGAEVRKRPAPL